MAEQNLIDETILQANRFINEDKFIKAEEIIQSLITNPDLKQNLKPHHYDSIANIHLITCNFELAADTYNKTGNQSGIAFSYIFLREISKAKESLRLAADSPLKLWCQYLCELFSENNIVKNYPSYFEIRNFLETTVYVLLRSKNYPYIELIVNNLNKLLKINPDSEKSVGYAFLNFGDLNNAEICLNNSSKRNPSDGEAFFMLGKLYLKKGLAHDAIIVLQNALLLLPDNLTIKKLLNEAKSML